MSISSYILCFSDNPLMVFTSSILWLEGYDADWQVLVECVFELEEAGLWQPGLLQWRDLSQKGSTIVTHRNSLGYFTQTTPLPLPAPPPTSRAHKQEASPSSRRKLSITHAPPKVRRSSILTTGDNTDSGTESGSQREESSLMRMSLPPTSTVSFSKPS